MCRPKSGSRGRASGGARRAADRFEAESLEFHEKLRDAYLHLAACEPDRCVLDRCRASRKPRVAARIWDTVAKRLDPATAPVALEDVAS